MHALEIVGSTVPGLGAALPQQWHRADPHIVGAPLAVFGALFVGIGLFVILATVRRRLRWVRASGRIVGVEASSVGDLPRVEFVDDLGIRRHFTSRYAHNRQADLREGTAVDVLVNPKDPSEGMIASGQLAGMRVSVVVGGIFGLVGGFFLTIGIVLLNVTPQPQGW
jgi:hypothetical protein